MVEAEGLPRGWDAADALADGWTPEALSKVVQWVPAPRPGAEPATGDQFEPDHPEPYFEETDAALLYRGVYKDKGGNYQHTSPVRVCSPIWIRARIRTIEENAYGRLVELRNPDGNLVRLAVPYSTLRGSGEELRGSLFDLGLEIGIHRDASRLLVDYFKRSDPAGWARCTQRTGWQGEPGEVFVFPDRTLGEGKEQWVYQEEGARVVQLGEAGALAEWRDNVASLCPGNSRLIFGLSCGFASPLLALVGEESGGFHLYGESSNPSSTGKTTAFRVISSLFGPPDYMKGHRATDNGLESPAVQHTDLLLLLNDLNQAEPRKVGPLVYMLANESEKIRGARSGGARGVKTWRLLFLSNGETTLSNYIRSAGIEPSAGALVRMPDIPADAGAGYGCFESLHGFENGRAFAKVLKERAARYYGTAGPAFIEQVIARRATLSEAIKKARAEFVHEALGNFEKVAAPVGRVADRFGLVAAAGELATAFGITGWEQHEAERSVMRCFRDWLRERGGPGNLEEDRIKANVRHFIELNGDSQFIDWERADRGDDHRPKTSMAAGFARYRYDPKPTRYYVTKERFRRDLSKSFNFRDVERVLLQAGWLIESGDTPARPMRNEKLPISGRERCYVLELPEAPSDPDSGSARDGGQ